MFCAAIPVTAALGAKLNADQVRQSKPASEADTHRRPMLKLTAIAIGLLLIGSITYHTLTYRP
jgi:hypothetical protein